MISSCPIPPKTSFTYIFRVNDKPGTYFYHGHLGGIRAAGLYGVLIIDPAPGVSEQWSYDGEHTLLLSDWYHAIQHELSIGLLEEEFRWAGMRAQFLTKLVFLLKFINGCRTSMITVSYTLIGFLRSCLRSSIMGNSNNGNQIPWVPEAFLARFPVSVKS